MLKNLFKTAWRNLLRNKAFSFINLLGLVLGMGCSLLIFLWVQDERNMDAFHTRSANIYGVYERVFSEGKVEAAHWTPGLLATELKRRVPEVQYASSFDPNQSATFEVGQKIITMQTFLQTVNLGFDREDLLYTPMQGDLYQKFAAFKTELSGMPGIKAVARTDQPPQQTGAHAYDMEWEGKDPTTRTVVIHVTVGYDFAKMLNLQFLQGRDFSLAFPTDTAAYIINETALKLIGYKDPIGRPLSIFGSRNHIIGVVRDFHFKSLHDPIEPLLINLNEKIDWGFVLVKTRPGKASTIFRMLSADFLQLVALAFLFASPVAWLLMNDWLRAYPYRTDISWWIFVVAGASALLVALLTVSYQSIKSALANPIQSLRAE